MTTYMSPEDWDEQFRRELKDGFAMFPEKNATLNEIRFEGEYPDTLVQVIFTDVRHPECIFGFNWNTGGWLQGMPEYYADDPEALATMLRINFMEAVAMRVPKTECVTGEIAWVN